MVAPTLLIFRHLFISVSWYETQLFILTLFLHPNFWNPLFQDQTYEIPTEQDFAQNADLCSAMCPSKTIAPLFYKLLPEENDV